MKLPLVILGAVAGGLISMVISADKKPESKEAEILPFTPPAPAPVASKEPENKPTGEAA